MVDWRKNNYDWLKKRTILFTVNRTNQQVIIIEQQNACDNINRMGICKSLLPQPLAWLCVRNHQRLRTFWLTPKMNPRISSRKKLLNLEVEILQVVKNVVSFNYHTIVSHHELLDGRKKSLVILKNLLEHKNVQHFLFLQANKKTSNWKGGFPRTYGFWRHWFNMLLLILDHIKIQASINTRQYGSKHVIGVSFICLPYRVCTHSFLSSQSWYLLSDTKITFARYQFINDNKIMNVNGIA